MGKGRLEGGKVMDRRVMNAGLNSVLLEKFRNRIALRGTVEDHGINVIRRLLRFGQRGQWENDTQIRFGKTLVVMANQVRALLVEERKLRELHQPKCCANIVKSEIESEFEHVVMSGPAFLAIPARDGHSMRSQQTQPPRQLRVVRGDHAAFGRGDVLISKKTEAAGVTKTSARLPPEHRAGGVRGIFDKK